MRLATTPLVGQGSHAEPLQVTLLELVKAVSECTEDEDEVVATVAYMIENESVRLVGNFRGSSGKDFLR